MKQALIVQLIFVVLILSGCGTQVHHFVKSGETLYAVSFYYGVDYHDVARWNNIKPPYIIKPGQRLRMAPPVGEARQVTRPKAVDVTRPAGSGATMPDRPSASAAPQWRWPAPGKLANTFSDRDNGRKGIDIINREGTPVRAAAGGKVVYAGTGLARYGNLIIIKHSGKYLSAYAHNRKVFVQEGDEVSAGQMIAEMGRNPSSQSMLHFEIRAYGQPVDPQRYLPKK